MQLLIKAEKKQMKSVAEARMGELSLRTDQPLHRWLACLEPGRYQFRTYLSTPCTKGAML